MRAVRFFSRDAGGLPGIGWAGKNPVDGQRSTPFQPIVHVDVTTAFLFQGLLENSCSGGASILVLFLNPGVGCEGFHCGLIRPPRFEQPASRVGVKERPSNIACGTNRFPVQFQESSQFVTLSQCSRHIHRKDCWRETQQVAFKSKREPQSRRFIPNSAG